MDIGAEKTGGYPLFGPWHLMRGQLGFDLRRTSLIVLCQKLQRPGVMFVVRRGCQFAASARKRFELIRSFHVAHPCGRINES